VRPSADNSEGAKRISHGQHHLSHPTSSPSEEKLTSRPRQNTITSTRVRTCSLSSRSLDGHDGVPRPLPEQRSSKLCLKITGLGIASAMSAYKLAAKACSRRPTRNGALSTLSQATSMTTLLGQYLYAGTGYTGRV